MDGKGRAADNAFIERLWRNVKQQCIYLNSPQGGIELRGLLTAYFTFYNHHPQQNLDGLTPGHLHFGLPDKRNGSLTPTIDQDQTTLTNA